MNSLFPNSNESSQSHLNTGENFSSKSRVEQYWEVIKSNLANYFSAETISNWLAPMKVKYTENSLIILVPNMVVYQQFVAEILPTINQIKSDKDLDKLKIGRLVPYVGVGIGVSNLVFPKATRPAFVIDQLHTEVAAGLTYPMKNLELFAEALYGGVGKTVYGFHDGKSAIVADNLRTFSYTAGIRVPF